MFHISNSFKEKESILSTYLHKIQSGVKIWASFAVLELPVTTTDTSNITKYVFRTFHEAFASVAPNNSQLSQKKIWKWHFISEYCFLKHLSDKL